MRIAQNQTIERILESENYNLKGVVIGDKGHSLDIYNRNDSICHRSFILDFNKGEYKITMNNTGMMIERLVERPEDKGGNYYETLQKIENGKCYWENSSSKRRGYKPLKIPFGAKIVSK